MKYLLLFSAVICLLDATAQNVNIPDANFKAALVSNFSINTNFDSEIQVSEAAAFTGTISIGGQSISDLTGLEAFTALTGLYCWTNSLTNLNVSANTSLTVLSCWNNSLTSLDISANTDLTDLVCYNNYLTSLDVSANTALTVLSCYGNSLTSLDVSANTALTGLFCLNNSLTSLNVSANTTLTGLACSNNLLTSLNVKNGNNINMDDFRAMGNPNLSCIDVDDATWATANWTVAGSNIDATVSFSESCPVGINDHLNTSTLTVFPNPTNSLFTIETTLQSSSILQTEIKNILGQTIYTFSEKANNGLYKKTIDLNLGQGLYFLTLQTNDGLMTKRIEVVK